MAYLEAAVVVYLRNALSIGTEDVFPLRPADALGNLAAIEFGREAATLVMLAAIGWLAGRSFLERLAWCAVAFGIWDLGYYAWLWVFSGWPGSLETWDLLFFIPVPWVGPVWAPSVVSVALVAFGLAAARTASLGHALYVRRREVVAGILGGVLVVVSFTADWRWIADGGLPRSFPWPLFAAGIIAAAAAATSTLRRSLLPARSETDVQPQPSGGFV